MKFSLFNSHDVLTTFREYFIPDAITFGLKEENQESDVVISVMHRKLSRSYPELGCLLTSSYSGISTSLRYRLPKTRQKEISSQGTIIEVGCNFVLMRHFRGQLFKRFLLCKCFVVYACGQIDFADFESVDTLR